MMNETPENNADFAREEWCLGLKLMRERQMTAEEKAHLLRAGRAMQTRGCAGCALIPLLFLTLMACSSDLPAGSITDSGWSMLAVGMMMFALAVSSLSSNDSAGRGRMLKCDARDGTVKIFAGALPEIEEESELAWLAAYQSNETTRLSLEWLPQSKRIWKINGQNVREWRDAEKTTSAPYPTNASWTTFPVRENLATTEIVERELSAAEREELRDYARHHWRKPALKALLMSLWIDIPVAIYLFTDTPLRFEITAYFLIALAFFSAWDFWQSLQRAQAWSADAQSGYVVVPDNAEETIEKAPVVEMLPHSQMAWMIGNQPAPWRTHADNVVSKR